MKRDRETCDNTELVVEGGLDDVVLKFSKGRIKGG